MWHHLRSFARPLRHFAKASSSRFRAKRTSRVDPALFVCLCLFPGLAAAQEAKRPLTVADSIEATKVLRVSSVSNDAVLFSHDGARYLVVLQRGDIVRNGSWVELLSGSTASLDAASRPSVVARLLSKSTA